MSAAKLTVPASVFTPPTKALTDEKYRLDSAANELRAKLSTSDRQNKEMSEALHKTRECNEARLPWCLPCPLQGLVAHAQGVWVAGAENRELDMHHHDSEKKINSTNVKMATIEQQLRDKDELLEKMSALLEASSSQKSQLEDTVTLLKSEPWPPALPLAGDPYAIRQLTTVHSVPVAGTTQKYDAKVKASIAEIHKGNGYIDQLSNELQACKSTVKLKSAIVRQQEQLLTEKDASSANSSHETSNLRAEILRHKGSSESLQAALEVANGKIEDAQKQLASNQQVISWLNKEVNEAQLGRRPGAGFTAGSGTPGEQGLPPPPRSPILVHGRLCTHVHHRVADWAVGDRRAGVQAQCRVRRTSSSRAAARRTALVPSRRGAPEQLARRTAACRREEEEEEGRGTAESAAACPQPLLAHRAGVPLHRSEV